jgi:LysM repeat protein
MKKILYSLILLIVMTSFVVTGCTRSASKGGGGEVPTSTSEIPFPVGPSTNTNRMTEIISSTQTAAAMTTDTVQVNTPETGGVSTIPTVAVDTPVPTAKSVVIVSTPTPGLPATYTLHEGEFPFCIARRFNINAGDLMALNNVSGDVSPGTTLTIPTNSVWPSEFDRALREHPTTYVVSTGDTIYKVACLFGDVDPNALIEANGLVEPYNLTSGTTIQIP